MNKKFLLKSKILLLFILSIFYSGLLKADELVPCLIFTGPSTEDYKLDSGTYNRIYLGENGFKIHSTSDSSSSDIELFYSLYNHIEFREDFPSTGIEEIVADGKSYLVYKAELKCLEINSSSDGEFKIGIFDLGGKLIATSNLGGAKSLSVESLAPGLYIAIAYNGKEKINLKFIIK